MLAIAKVVVMPDSANLHEPIHSLPTEDGQHIELRRWSHDMQMYTIWIVTREQAVKLVGDLARSLAQR